MRKTTQLLIFAVGVCALLFISGCTEKEVPIVNDETPSGESSTQVNVVEEPPAEQTAPEINTTVIEEPEAAEPEPVKPAESFAYDIHGTLTRQSCTYTNGQVCRVAPLDAEVVITEPISFDTGKVYNFEISSSSIIRRVAGNGTYSMPVNPGKYSVFVNYNGKYFCRYKTDGTACLVTVTNKSMEYSVMVTETTY
jgi:hypothetical protein